MSDQSLFLGPNQTVTATRTEATPTASETLYLVGDVATSIGTSVTTVKRMASELRLDLIHTVGGVKLFTADQVQKLKVEKARRQTEAWR